MQANTLDEEAVQLLAFAKDIVTVFGARRMEAPRIWPRLKNYGSQALKIGDIVSALVLVFGCFAGQ